MDKWQRKKGGWHWAKLSKLKCVVAALVWVVCFTWWGFQIDIKGANNTNSGSTFQPIQRKQQPQKVVSEVEPSPSSPNVRGNDCTETPDGTCCITLEPTDNEKGHYDPVPWPVDFTDKKNMPFPAAEIRHNPTKLVEKNISPTPLSGCTDSLNAKGTAVTLPDWLLPVWDKISSSVSVDELSERLLSGGSVLVVWIPSKFMAPQKAGKNVRGEVVDAATRGQDNAYYLEEYKSVFHTSVKIGETTYHAQVLSRKALVVCLWERLHIKRYDCNGKIPIHFCQCRHCKDSVASGDVQAAHKFADGVPLPLQIPSLYKPPSGTITTFKKSIYKNTKQVQPKDTCLDGLSAPWLIPRSSITKLPYEGYHHDLEKLLSIQADSNNIVIVYIFNRFWIDHLHNVVYSMIARSGVTNFIVATLDCASLALCIKNRLPCMDGSLFAESERDMEVGGSGFKKGFQRKVTEELSWIKPRLALRILSSGYHFLMADMDMSWNYNPLENVVSRGIDFAHQCDTNNQQSINTGFYLLTNNKKTVRLFESIMVFPPWRLSDQNALKLSVKYDHTHGASNGCLDRWLYNMKCNYKVSSSEKHVSGKRTFKWKPQQRDPQKFDWFIFHATCLDGALAKIDWLRASNAWFLDELDSITAAPYCLRVGNKTLDGMTRRTLHSEKYPTEKDDTYLNERH
eukprot:TRINITY_DN18177_c0_g1_i1.p1 TRINITY_DN18177_c0_g1~~TRINITY_DN18177_c0_g1_i1.p1  ORF type:complete len:680 (+),score=104.29 TRINITY_DN18177_c0_g1_i1:70-2109(+)